MIPVATWNTTLLSVGIVRITASKNYRVTQQTWIDVVQSEMVLYDWFLIVPEVKGPGTVNEAVNMKGIHVCQPGGMFHFFQDMDENPEAPMILLLFFLLLPCLVDWIRTNATQYSTNINNLLLVAELCIVSTKTCMSTRVDTTYQVTLCIRTNEEQKTPSLIICMSEENQAESLDDQRCHDTRMHR